MPPVLSPDALQTLHRAVCAALGNDEIVRASRLLQMEDGALVFATNALLAPALMALRPALYDAIRRELT